MNTETISLFKSLLVESHEAKTPPNNEISKETIKSGFIFSDIVLYNYSYKDLYNLIPEIKYELGLSTNEMNNTFRKCWKNISQTPDFELLQLQVIHYTSTYGLSKLKMYNDYSVYIPNDAFDCPMENVPLIIINGITKKELKEKITKIFESGIAIKTDNVRSYTNIAKQIGYSDIENIKNKEIKMLMYRSLNKIPSRPEEFLRYLIYTITTKTLLIKDNETIEQIKNNLNGPLVVKDIELIEHILNLFNQYILENGLPKLSESFNRFKPLFLAMKVGCLKPIINRISKLSKTNHKPLPADYLNNVTNLLSQGGDLNSIQFIHELTKVNIFRKIRLLKTLNFHINKKSDTPLLYQIRNGKSYVKENNKEVNNIVEFKFAYDMVKANIANDLKENLEDKEIYLPENIEYVLPTSQKDFSGNIPNGSYIEVDSDITVGIQWFNKVKNQKIDLDLSLISLKNKVGWDSEFKDSTAMFSGDMTTAPKPNGASEVFYIKKGTMENYLMFNNFYNFEDNDESLDYKFFIAKSKFENQKSDHLVKPSENVLLTNLNIGESEKNIGFIQSLENSIRFYINETTTSKNAVSGDNAINIQRIKYLVEYNNHTITLRSLLEQSGIKIVDTPTKDCIDLSVEKLQIDTISNLFLK